MVKNSKITKKIINCLPSLWQSWFVEHINIEELDEKEKEETPFAGVCVQNNRIMMYINSDRLVNMNDNDLLNLMKHEIAHIIRGDILVKGVIHDIAVISQDAIINSKLGIESVDGVEGVTIKNLQQYFPEVPDYPLGWKEIYDIIVKNSEVKINISAGNDILESDNSDIEKVLREAVIDLMIEDPKVMEQVSFNKENMTRVNFRMKTSTLLEQIIRKIRSHTGNRKKMKSYRREHPSCNMIKSISRIPVNNILLVLDVSGSYANYTETILGLFYWLRKVKDIGYKMGVFSDTFSVINSTDISNIPGYGGATYIKGMFNHLQKNKYDLVIVFTDGYIYDYGTELRNSYKGKILWILDTPETSDSFKGDEILYNDKILK